MQFKNVIGPIIAVVVASIAVIWMLAGDNGITVSPTESSPQESAPSSQAEETALIHSVQAETLTAATIEMHLPLSGTTEANETLNLINSYSGRVTKLAIKKGTFIKKGTPILQIDTRTLKIEIEQARLLIKQRNLELDGIKRLAANNFSSKINLAKAETELAAAKAAEHSLLVDLENATLTAPFSGIVNTLDVQEGQVLGNGVSIGTLVSLNPIKVSVNIPQNKIEKIQLGILGDIHLESGYEAEGVISYISTTANSSSRTITVEIQVDNPENKIPSGLTAAVNFILGTQKAHSFSPALLTLDDAGNTAIKMIDIDNSVVIAPVQIVKSERDKVWVSGLPDNVNIITVGQGFVSAGDTVEAHYQN